MELSQNDIYSLLSTAIHKAVGTSADTYGPYIRDVYPTYLVYSGKDDTLFQCEYTIDAGTKAVTLGTPAQVVQVTGYAPVATTPAFALPTGKAARFSDADTVTRRGKIFSVGEYEDVGYSMNAEELAEAVRNFQPVPVDLDHHNTVLDDKLGLLQAVELSEDGNDLIGSVSFPKWLDTVLGQAERKVSCTWDRGTKQLRKLALTNNPRVADAVLFSAYVTFAGARHSAKDIAELQTIHDLVVKQGAACSPEGMPATMSSTPTTGNRQSTPQPDNRQAIMQKENKRMTFMDRLADFIKGVPQDELAAFTTDSGDETTTTTTTTPTPSPTPSPPAPDPHVAALEAQLAQQTAAFAKVQDERRIEKATAKVDAFITAGKLLPYERAGAIAQFTMAMQDDERDATLVTFSDAEGKEQKATRAQLVEIQYQARQAHMLTTEQVAAFALPTSGENKDSEAEHQKKLDALIGVTSMGKAALNGKNN